MPRGGMVLGAVCLVGVVVVVDHDDDEEEEEEQHIHHFMFKCASFCLPLSSLKA